MLAILTDLGLTQTCDKSHDYKRVYLGRICVSQWFVVAQFIAHCVSPMTAG